MTMYSHFSPHAYHNPALTGAATGGRGYAIAYALTEIYGQLYVARLVWEHVRSAAQELEDFAFLQHVDGELLQVVIGQTEGQVGPLRPDVPYAIEVFPVSTVEMSRLQTSLGEAQVSPRGSRVRLTLAKPTGDFGDFANYEAWYDAGDEDGVADTLLKSQQGIDQNVVASPALSELNYTFKQKYVDRLGNETALGAAAAIDVLPIPLEPTSPAIAYSAVTDRATLTATVPGSQVAGVVGYVVYSNWLPGQGLRARVIENDWSRLGFATVVASAISFTTFDLWTGQWRFGIKAISGLGVESDFTELRLNLADGGGGLDEVVVQPNAPHYIDAVPIIAGDIEVTVWHDGADSDGLKLYRDAVLVATEASVGVTAHTFTDTGLTGGVEYAYTAKAFNGAILSDASAEVSATSDDSAPTGPLTIALELIH